MTSTISANVGGTDAASAWRRSCHQPRNTFQIGTRVRHRNPKYAWRGIVEPETTGPHRGKCIRLSRPFDGHQLVRIRWIAGSYDQHGVAAGWYLVTTIALAADPPLIASLRVDLVDQPHTITIERVDVETARAQWAASEYHTHIDELAIVERHEGRLSKVCWVASQSRLGTPMDLIARVTAHTYRATYIDVAGSAR
jgi:hypothetical protein